MFTEAIKLQPSSFYCLSNQQLVIFLVVIVIRTAVAHASPTLSHPCRSPNGTIKHNKSCSLGFNHGARSKRLATSQRWPSMRGMLNHKYVTIWKYWAHLFLRHTICWKAKACKRFSLSHSEWCFWSGQDHFRAFFHSKPAMSSVHYDLSAYTS